MRITPFTRNQVFQPEQINAMSEAFTRACLSLGLVERSDPATELVAKRIMQLTQRGAASARTLCRDHARVQTGSKLSFRRERRGLRPAFFSGEEAPKRLRLL